MKKSCLYFDKNKYKCVSFIVHYKGLTLSDKLESTQKRSDRCIAANCLNTSIEPKVHGSIFVK